jgi:hypothetical protein
MNTETNTETKPETNTETKPVIEIDPSSVGHFCTVKYEDEEEPVDGIIVEYNDPWFLGDPTVAVFLLDAYIIDASVELDQIIEIRELVKSDKSK